MQSCEAAKGNDMNTPSPGDGQSPARTHPQELFSLSDNAIRRALTRIAHEIAERNEDSRERCAARHPGRWGSDVRPARQDPGGDLGPSRTPGALDISMHRDDLNQRAAPQVLPTHIPFDVTAKTVVLVDDVVFSGRTIRAAMDSLHDFGRPARIQLAALVDRGHRELPIKADFVGKNVPTSPNEKVRVRLQGSCRVGRSDS